MAAPVNSSVSASREEAEFDVIVTHSAGNDALWFGAQLAFDLAQTGAGPTRLFTDCVAELIAQEGKTTDRGTLRDVKVIDHRQLCQVRPARKSIVVFDSVVPRAYDRERARVGGTPFRLLPLGVRQRSAEESFGIAGERLLRMGVGPLGDGIVRPMDRQVLLADRLQALRTRPHDHARSVLLAPGPGTDLTHWLSLLESSTHRVSAVAVPAPEDSHREMHRGPARGMTHSMPVTWLRDQRWLARDRIVAQCDLVLCADAALAVRCVALGVPVIYLNFEAGREDDCVEAGRTILHWNQGRAAKETSQAMAALSLAWALDIRVNEAWAAFLECWDDALEAAASAAVQFHSWPVLASTCCAIPSPSSPNEANFIPASLQPPPPKRFDDTLPMSSLPS